MPRIHVYPACVRRTMDTWNFGQILPVLLSITPFYNVLKHCFREGNPLKAILTRGRKSLHGESRRDTPRSPETEPESQSNLSALFIDLDSSCRAAGASENNLPGIGTRRTDEEALAALHQRIYSLTWFRNLLTLLCILVVGIVAAYFVEATIAICWAGATLYLVYERLASYACYCCWICCIFETISCFLAGTVFQ